MVIFGLWLVDADGCAMLRDMTNAPTHFQIIDNFNGQSARPVCYFTNLEKQVRTTPQQQDHEVDEFILRGPLVDFEGYIDIRPAVIIDTAREVFGMISAAEAQVLAQVDADLNAALAEAEAQIESLKTQLRAMILANAEQIVQEEALAAELGQAYEDLYAPEEMLALIDGEDAE